MADGRPNDLDISATVLQPPDTVRGARIARDAAMSAIIAARSRVNVLADDHRQRGATTWSPSLVRAQADLEAANQEIARANAALATAIQQWLPAVAAIIETTCAFDEKKLVAAAALSTIVAISDEIQNLHDALRREEIEDSLPRGAVEWLALRRLALNVMSDVRD